MNEAQKKTTQEILKLMLNLPWDQREAVWSVVTYNDVFCVYCGVGEVGNENTHCQCNNDE